MKPLVTIITPSYNQGQFIEETILSVINQTYNNLEYIIVDGGSTDNTMEIVKKYKDKIKVVIHEKDNGQSDAINKGFKIATGHLAGWINSDDIIYSDCVENIVKLYQGNPAGAIFYCETLDWIDKTSKKINSVKVPIKERRDLLNKNYSLIQQGSFYNSELLKKIDYLDESIKYCMDLDLWLRLLEVGNIYSLKGKAFSAFRVWEETKTSKGKDKFLKEIKATLKKNSFTYFSKNHYKIQRNLTLYSLRKFFS